MTGDGRNVEHHVPLKGSSMRSMEVTNRLLSRDVTEWFERSHIPDEPYIHSVLHQAQGVATNSQPQCVPGQQGLSSTPCHRSPTHRRKDGCS